VSTEHKIYEDDNTTITVTESSSQHYIEMNSRYHDCIELSTTKLCKRDYLDVIVRLLESFNYATDNTTAGYVEDAVKCINSARSIDA